MNPLGVKLKHAGDENNLQVISSRIVLVSTSGLPSGSNENIQYFYYY